MLGYAPKLERCNAERGERTTISAVRSPTKKSWYSMPEERTVKDCMDGFLLNSLCLWRHFLVAARNLVALLIFSLTVLPVLTQTVVYSLSACLHVAFTMLATASSLALCHSVINMSFTFFSFPCLFWPPQTAFGHGVLIVQMCFEQFHLLTRLFTILCWKLCTWLFPLLTCVHPVSSLCRYPHHPP